MTERKIYQATNSQTRKWDEFTPVVVPDDDWFKARWTCTHHGKTRGWGLGKRDWMLSQMKNSRDYQMGLWQGRVDAARNVDYAEERNENTYNLGYHRGYTEYQSNRRGWDQATREKFDSKYLAD